MATGESERRFVAEKDKAGAGENGAFLGRGRIRAVGDAVDAVGFADVFGESGDVFGGDERWAGAVQEKIGPRERVGEIGAGGAAISAERAFDDFQLREAAVLHGHDFLGEIGGGPEAHFGVWEIFFDEGEDARRVRDIADVYDLPRGTQEDARGASSGSVWDSASKRGDEGGGRSRGEEGAAIQGARGWVQLNRARRLSPSQNYCDFM